MNVDMDDALFSPVFFLIPATAAADAAAYGFRDAPRDAICIRSGC